MKMARCGYKTRVLDEEWKCPLDALPGEEYCYWHKEEDGKEPTEEQLEELKEKIFGVYLVMANLKGTDLVGANLQIANLPRANLQEADLSWANLQGANLFNADLRGTILFSSNLRETILSLSSLQGSNLVGANLQRANLHRANLQGSNLVGSELQEADLSLAKLQETNLANANLQGANIYGTKLQVANLVGAKFDSQTVLDKSILIGANLFHSYFDEAKSFRNAKMFQNDGDKEINEVVGNALNGWFIKVLKNSIKHPVKTILDSMSFVVAKVSKKKPCIPLFLKPQVIDMGLIKKRAPRAATKFRGKGSIRYVGKSNRIIFFDRSSGCVIENPENWRRHERSPIRVRDSPT